MNTIYKISQSLICIFAFSFSTYGQGQKPIFYQNLDEIKVIGANGGTMTNPWTGGMLNPQFSNIDLNGDGMQDLFIFDRFAEPGSPGKVLTFINQGYGYFKYEPWYETFFPSMTNWCLLKDYNNDGKNDIFSSTSNPGGYVNIYTNTTVQGESPSFKLFKPEYNFRYFFSQNNNGCCPSYSALYVDPREIPDIDDINGDGAIDFLTADIANSFGNFYINRALSKHDNIDSFDLAIHSNCWMAYYEFSTYDVTLGHPGCGPINIAAKTSADLGYNLLTLSLSHWDDKDLIMGDLQWNNLIAIYNGRDSFNWNQDTAVSWDSLFPSNTLPAYIPTFPAPFYVDIDNDGKRDLIVTPQAVGTSANLNNIWYYHNNGTDAHPVFDFVQKDFLQNTMIELGEKASPAFFDYNGDGLPDMVVATLGDYIQTGYKYERLVLYENIGTAQKAVFKKVDDDYLHLSAMGVTGMRPAFGDLDGDGAVDMLLGAENNIYFFKNISAKGQKDSFVLVSQNYANLDTLGTYLAPYIVDLNKDGLPDIVMGDYNGNFNYLQNTGTATNPQFILKTNFLGRLEATYYFWQCIGTNASGDSCDDSIWVPAVPAFSAPVVADINGDGKLDLLSGSYSGEIYLWLDIEDHLTDSCPGRVDTFFYNVKKGKLEDKLLGNKTAPAVAFLDGDTLLPDMVIGNERGGLNYFSQHNVPLGIAPAATLDNRFKVYPNPTDKYLIIEATMNNPLSNINITLYTVSGQQVFEKQFTKFTGSAQLDVSKLAAGVYYLSINSTGSAAWTTKVEVR